MCWCEILVGVRKARASAPTRAVLHVCDEQRGIGGHVGSPHTAAEGQAAALALTTCRAQQHQQQRNTDGQRNGQRKLSPAQARRAPSICMVMRASRRAVPCVLDLAHARHPTYELKCVLDVHRRPRGAEVPQPVTLPCAPTFITPIHVRKRSDAPIVKLPYSFVARHINRKLKGLREAAGDSLHVTHVGVGQPIIRHGQVVQPLLAGGRGCGCLGGGAATSGRFMSSGRCRRGC